jgi:alpha-1,2-mannosyltransferase
VLLFAALPLALIASRSGVDSLHLVDFRNLWHASQDVAAGRSPYHPAPRPGTALTADCVTSAPDCYVYPPLAAVLAVPLGWLPFAAAGVLFFLLDIAALGGALWLAGVRDWRCYGVAAASGPALSSFEGGTLTPLLALAVAAAWRYRGSRAGSAVAVALALAAKIFLWPLLVWLAATRRIAAALLAAALAALVCTVSWAPLGFAGLTGYPHLLHSVSAVWQPHAYGPVGLGLALGLPSSGATALALLSGGCVLAVAAVLGRRPGGDRVSFALAVAASLLLTPIVWLHYLLLLLVPLAIARPRLDRAWALTVPLFFLPGMADGSVGVNLVAIALAGALVWVSVSDLPDAVGDERHAFARLANADSL